MRSICPARPIASQACHWFYNGLDEYDWDVNKWCEQLDDFETFLKARPFFYFEFPAAKDPSYAERNPGKSNCIIILITKREWFGAQGDDEADAQAQKRVADAYIELLYERRCRPPLV